MRAGQVAALISIMINLNQKYVLKDPFISAGSGIELVQDKFYLVADDELDLYTLRKDLSSKVQVHKVFPGELPEGYETRKKAKPDFEAITSLGRELLILPSGSRPNRHQGALVSIESLQPRLISFKEVFSFLETKLPELNIEGAIRLGENIRLFQRGNGGLHQNGIIDLNLTAFLKDEVQDYKFQLIDLGTSSGAPLTFTDATIINEEILFLAASEKVESTYDDGEFGGAILGRMSLSGRVLKTYPLNISSKPEGLCSDGNEFFIVTDADDRGQPSVLYSGIIGEL